MVIVKSRTYTETSWCVSHIGYPTSQTLYLDSTTETLTRDRITARSASTFDVGSHFEVNEDGYTYAAYCWAEIPGLQKFGIYTGNGTSTNFVHLGFRPTFVMVKRTDSANGWFIGDSARNPYNQLSANLRADTGNSESTIGTVPQDFVSNGFVLKDASGAHNASGGTYIYAAFAEAPTFNLYGGQANAR